MSKKYHRKIVRIPPSKPKQRITGIWYFLTLLLIGGLIALGVGYLILVISGDTILSYATSAVLFSLIVLAGMIYGHRSGRNPLG